VYLAGPEVFLPDALDIGERKKRICAQHGFTGLFPSDSDAASGDPHLDSAAAIFRHCVACMDRADLVIANMTPFRGVSMDVGTAVELGYMYARGVPVFGYTNVADDYGERVEADGMSVEAFGLCDNLMCESAVVASGARVVRTTVDADVRYTDLAGFEECVRAAAEVFWLTP
jgi:nucleoside 2-deoxyribosyltransferase